MRIFLSILLLSASTLANATGMGGNDIWGFLFAFLVYALLIVIPAWRIFSRAGLHPALSLLAIIPGIGIIVLWIFAFVKWPSCPNQ
jgi:hypothetical protein